MRTGAEGSGISLRSCPEIRIVKLVLRMALMALSIAWLVLVAALLVRAVTQYRHYQVIGPVAPTAAESGPRPLPCVTVIVPARNEAHNIRRCLDGLLAQDYPRGLLEIVVVDDSSEDGTAGIVLRAAQGDDRVRLVRGADLPQGWLGKPHACWQGAADARGQWLCFLDADTTARPPLIRTALSIVEGRKLDLLSLQPVQELVSVWERLILPAGFFFLAFTQDVRRTNDPSSSEASVNGQFLLIRRGAYEQVGGHAAVRMAVAEDSALAGLLKRSGHPIAVLGTERLLHTRMYASLRPLWEGTARQAAQLLPRVGALLVVAALAVVLAAAPVALPAWGAADLTRGIPLALAALIVSSLGTLALLGTHVGAARYFRIPVLYGFFFPAAYLLGAAVALYGLAQLRRHQVRWKGRTYFNSGARPELAARPARAANPPPAPPAPEELVPHREVE